MDHAYDVLADAFDVYDESIGNTYGEALPFVLADDDDEGDEDEGDDDVDEDDLDDDEIDGADLDDADADHEAYRG